MNFKSFYRSREAGIIFLLLLCTGFLFSEVINDRFWLSDLEVYYRTAGRLLNGQNLYRHAEDGHYVFKYSPVSALYFIPLLIFPFTTAKFLYWIFLTSIICLVYRSIIRSTTFSLTNPINKSRFNNVVIIGSIMFAVHFLRELHLGQVNYLLLASYIWSINLLENNKTIAYGILIAISIFLKPFGLIFIPWLVVKKRWQELGWIAGGLALLSILPWVFYRDWSLFVSQYAGWITELKIELSNKQSLLKPANHTIFSVIARYTPIGYLITEGGLSQKIYQLLVLAAVGLITLFYIRKEIKKDKAPSPELYDIAFLTAWIPMLSFTSENAFLFSLPAALILLSNWQKLTVIPKSLTAIGLLLVGGNFSEVTGKKLSQFLDDWSVLTPCAFLLLTALIILRTSISKSLESNN
jgi:hypothetical protein